MSKPIIELINGVHVVRDDLFPGGTKGRLFNEMFKEHDEIVYACSALSCTQASLAISANAAGKRATIFTAQRLKPSAATSFAKARGATINAISPGYLSVAQARAREYCAVTGAYQAPLGFDTPDVVQKLADIARACEIEPDEVWCVAGSGTLSRALQIAWPDAAHKAVIVGGGCDVGAAERLVYPGRFEKPTKYQPPFSSEPYYDAKAWEMCAKKLCGRAPGTVLFWNVLGDIFS